MTAPTLPETLAALAERVPERVRIEPDWSVSVYLSHRHYSAEHYLLLNWTGIGGRVYEGVGQDHPERLALLRAALEEECDARGWHWSIGTSRWTPEAEPPFYARIDAGPIVQADTPAHALALALLAALTAEGVGG